MAYEIKVEIEGISPLLQHRFGTEEKEGKSKQVSGARDYSEDCEKALYRLPDGTIYQPATHIEGALMKAASNFQIAGKRKKTYKDMVKGAVFVGPDAIPHVIQQFEDDARAVVVPATKGRVIRHRPRFDKWKLSFHIEVKDDQLPFEVVKEILDYAGNNVGIGDFRPRYGRFIVTSFQRVTS